MCIMHIARIEYGMKIKTETHQYITHKIISNIISEFDTGICVVNFENFTAKHLTYTIYCDSIVFKTNATKTITINEGTKSK